VARGIRKKDYERLDDATIARVVQLLKQDKPVTKKVACEILNISYNTKRLSSIIQEYEDKIAYTKRRMKENRGRAFGDLELKEIVINYLSGDSISSIAKSSFRSINVIKNKITELHLPERSKNSTYFNPDLMPDEMVSENFEPKELVWSSRYNSVAEIQDGKDSVYCIWVYGKHNQFAYQPWWELGKLKVLKQFKLRDDEFVTTQQTLDYRIE